jgi:hypothetical protein
VIGVSGMFTIQKGSGNSAKICWRDLRFAIINS